MKKESKMVEENFGNLKIRQPPSKTSESPCPCAEAVKNSRNIAVRDPLLFITNCHSFFFAIFSCCSILFLTLFKISRLKNLQPCEPLIFFTLHSKKKLVGRYLSEHVGYTWKETLKRSNAETLKR
ncbi:MAG: hypothetical protein BM485_01540 [Desulfobulbaceae bacterium DB1]|nr:MAG: hypothetical protein BM485_01540 [Desulfobulbaceae bacterium DB1]